MVMGDLPLETHLLMLGDGPGGYAAAVRAPDLGLDVTLAGGTQLAHAAMHAGKIAAEVIAGRPAAFDARAVPAVIYTHPQIAWCGLTETEAEQQGRDVQVARFPWRASGRALTRGTADGLTKLVMAPDTGRVLGFGAVGCGAEGGWWPRRCSRSRWARWQRTWRSPSIRTRPCRRPSARPRSAF